MNKQYQQVKKWSETFGLLVSDEYGIPDNKEVKLAFNLIQEELNETISATNHKNIVEVADGFADLLWVVFRAMQQFGLSEELLEKVFDEVDRSNNSKACQTIEEAKETQEKYNANGHECYIVEREGKFFVHRTADNKLLKANNYSPANIASIISEYNKTK